MDYDKAIEEMTATLAKMIAEIEWKLEDVIDPYEEPKAIREVYFELDNKLDALKDALIALERIGND
jgi:hypothetical protein